MTEMSSRLSKEELALAKSRESELFEKYYKWLDKNMTPSFFEEVSQEQLMLIVHNLMGLELSKYFAKIEMSDCAIVLSKNAPDADVRVLHEYQLHGIKNYVAFMSKDPPPIAGMEEKLRISIVQFTKFDRPDEGSEQILSWDEMKEIFNETSKRNSEISFDEFNSLFRSMNDRFIRSMTKERLALALDMFFRAKTRDNCQYEIIYNKDWKKHKSFVPSVQIVFAWRNTPKYRFLFRLAELFFRHKLKMSRVNATYITPYEKNNILMMSIGITGTSGKAAWDEADMDDFLKELVTLKYFEDRDRIQETFVKPGLVRGNIGNFLRTASTFAHQALVHVDSNLYTLENVEEALCRHPELSVEICNAFEQKFNPKKPNIKEYEKSKKRIFKRIQELDTGHEVNDARRKNVLSAALNFVEYTLKTNFYRNNKSALSYRIDPQYLDHIPFNRREKFPELPYGIFFVQGMNFIGFQIRFKDLARGGLRTVLPKEMEDLAVNRDSIFSECYNLSYTQQKKNKDIPEGGSKAIILLEPYKRLDFETDIYATELKGAEYTSECIEEVIACYRKDRKDQYLYHAQRSFVHSLMTLINCDDKGKLRYKDIVDYYDYPEFIYLGPDENMHNEMIEWIAAFSLSVGYKLGTAFISSKPKAGVNHKQFGVTSLGVHVCMDEALLYLDIDPKHEPFTVKITGGPDGDVAGNMILNLHKHYPKTAKLIALIDGSGTIRDPNGLDLDVLTALFRDGKPINNYPPEKLGDGAFLLDNWSKKQQSSYKQATLLWKKEKGELKQEWISGNKANHLLRMNVHETPADVFIPAGGRPRTLNEGNIYDFMTPKGLPTAKIIIEGANLYLTPKARQILTERGTVIIKDSSANKGGVICSSFEVLSNLSMGDQDFIDHKQELMQEILAIIAEKARDEASLLLRTHCETEASLIDISDWVSEKINHFTYEILEALTPIKLPNDPNNPLIRALLNYCPPLLRHDYEKEILENVPDIHKKAIIACFIGAKMVYTRGLSWSPSIADILPLIVNDPNILDPTLEP